MTKTELIKKITKNVGIPEADAKIFFELLLKRISAVVDTGQSIFINDFGYFHLIKGSIKKPIFSSQDNEALEEEIDLVLFSEEKDLRRSETKGLVFNIPIFDEDDYHPIDSSFSLSIGKPLIPLRGVPFDSIYIPTSGYEYRRLIESKVEKIIGTSQIAESVENFPTLVIDARSYNTNQVKLKWEDKIEDNIAEAILNEMDSTSEEKSVVGEYEEQNKELKNIAWDFGEDLSKQIEAESIIDITDERINLSLIEKKKEVSEEQKNENEPIENEDKEFNNTNDTVYEDGTKDQTEILESDLNTPETSEFKNIEEDSSKKLDSLLEIDDSTSESVEDIVIEINDEIDNKFDEVKAEVFPQNIIEEVKPEISESEFLASDVSDREFWESTSKYFETYKPVEEQVSAEPTMEEEFENYESKLSTPDELSGNIPEQINDLEVVNNEQPRMKELESKDDPEQEIDDVFLEKNDQENQNQNTVEFENIVEQKTEFFEARKKSNFVPFTVFILVIISASLALYWYLQIYKKNMVKETPKIVSMNNDNAKIIQRNFDIPISFPYLPKVNETTISENNSPPKEETISSSKNITDQKVEEKKPPKQVLVKKDTKSQKTEIQKPVNSVKPSGTGLNVGNNIFKYGNYFVVQVASFRASSISENEAGKYRNKGFNAFVETADIPNRGKWYRVRVGNFTSKEDAQRFAEKNIR